jgi:hypothetical protein
MNRFSGTEEAGAFDHGEEQDERDRKMYRERMEAADELAEVASLNSIRRSVQGGHQKHEYDEQTDAAEN